MRSVILVGAAALLVAAYWIFLRPADNERFVRLDAPKRSPSGAFTAYVVPGPVQNSVKTLIPVIRDSNNIEVFHDTEAYSTRHGVGVTWLSTKDQLWILSGDVGDAYVELGADGAWHKTRLTPEMKNPIPSEIEKLTR